MKKIIHKVQELGKKAADIQQTIQSAPAKAAELRKAVVMSATELHQIRSDVQSNLHGLRVNSEEHLLTAMREINDAALLFEEAGYELSGLDLDLSLPQKLAVHLQKFEDVPHATLRGFLSNEARVTIKSILAGIIKAEETAANVELTYLNLTGLVVHVGAVPLVRMCWRADGPAEASPVIAANAHISTPEPPPTSSSPAFGSFFEQRTIPGSTVAAPPAATTLTTAETSLPAVAEAASSAEKSSPPLTGDWKRDALERFKKMPDFSKRR